jgi:predicted porin
MKTQHAAGLAGLALVALAPAAHAVSITKDDVTLDITGIVNGYYVYRTSEVPGSPKVSNSGVSNGLLPGWVNFVFTTKAGGLDLKAHIGLAPGINDSSSVIGLPSTVGNGAGAIPGATSPYSQIDTRANYLSFGNASMGTVKLGRDIGIFGTQVILSDMTLLGVGGTSNAAQPFNTTFGMIGHGYMYTGFQAQVAYASPTFSGAQVQVGLFQPKQFSGNQTKTPGLQAGLTFAAGPAKLWGSVVSQKTECVGAPCASGAGYTANGAEFGGKVGLGSAELLAYAFTGKGLGLSTVGAQFFGGADAAGNKTKSDGYLLQATYKLGDTKLGVNYGENRDKNGLLGNGNQQKNKSYTLGAYHSLNKYLTLTGEFNNEKKPGVVFLNEKVNTFSLGAIAFF